MERNREGKLLESTRQTYLQDEGPDYGRIDTAITTINDLATVTRYVYITEADRLRTEIIVEGYDFTGDNPVSRSISTDSRSSLTGQTIEETSAAGVTTAYQYDLLGRITETVIAKGSGYEATRTCDYHLSDSFTKDNRPKMLASSVALEETDASGQRRRSWLDGKGRTVSVELEDLVNGTEGTFRELSRTTFDPFGRVEIANTVLEWLADGTKAFELTTITGYDDWGNANTVISPTGVTSHTWHDPIAMRTEQWQETASGRTYR